VFDHFGVRNDPRYYDTEQYTGGIIFIRKCAESVKIIKEWLRVFEDDFSLVDDSPSKSDNFPGFIENRHDQSVISLLSKKYALDAISTNEYEQVKLYLLEKYPIWAVRDKNDGSIGALIKRVKIFGRSHRLTCRLYYWLKNMRRAE